MATEFLLLGLACVGLGVSAGLLGLDRRRQRDQAGARNLLQRSRKQYEEMKLALAQLERLERWQKNATSGIEGSTAAVRAIHRGIAEIPFGILEQIPSTSATTRQVRRIHDLSSDTIYASITQASRWLGKRAQAELQRPYRNRMKDAPEDKGADEASTTARTPRSRRERDQK